MHRLTPAQTASVFTAHVGRRVYANPTSLGGRGLEGTLLRVHHDADTDSLYLDFKTDAGRVERRPYEQVCLLMTLGEVKPLFLIPGHPANGKTAFQVGLAIDPVIAFSRQPVPVPAGWLR